MVNIAPTTLTFLKDLEAHNNRDWFNENKSWYQKEHAQVTTFVDVLLERMKELDQLETLSGKKSLMRIYRDTRFSKIKTPYNPRFAGSFKRVKPQLRGGYFFRIMPGATLVGGGFYGPSSEDLKLLRGQLAQDAEPLRAVMNSSAFKQTFGHLQGEQVKTAPKGYPKDHQEIDLLRYKSMYVFREFTDEEVLSGNFMDEMIGTWNVIRPFFDVMTDYLTTDLNGISLIDE